MVTVTGPLEVDTEALEAVARELNGLSDQLTAGGVTHEWQPPVAQPSGPAAVRVTAAANHVVSEAAANMVLFADDIASAARYYASRDHEEADRIGSTMQPPR